jgi:uncharacterized membrane protein
MSKLIVPGRIMFALGIIALGILQFFAKDYIVARPPSPQWSAQIPGKLAWAYISGVILIISGLAIAVRIKPNRVALFIGIFILLFSFFLRHLPEMIGLGFEGILWSINAYKSFVFFGGALLVAASFYIQEGRNSSGTFSNKRLIAIGIICLSFFLIIGGAAHFKFHEFVPMLIPDYIPAHTFWTYFAGAALIAGGIGLIFKQTRRWAAALSGLMIFLWFLLLHLPRAFATPDVYDEWMGVCESFTFSGILFLVAGLNNNENPFRKKNTAGTIIAKTPIHE